MPRLAQISPSDYHPIGDTTGPDMAQWSQQFLAQGDSWFSFGSLVRMDNLLDHVDTARSAVALNCAQPGAVLAHMTDTTSLPVFRALLTERFGQKWDAILLSGGGNDLIDALWQSPDNPPAQRLLLKPDEWTQAAGAARYVSAAGWSAFEAHMGDVMASFFGHLAQDINAGTPVVMHTYDFATPRNSGVVLGPLHAGPWIFKACQAFGLPEAHWRDLACELLGRWARMLAGYRAVYPQLRVVDTQGLLEPAATTDTGPTAEWENEIHPNGAGYARLAARWTPVLDALPPR